MDSLQGQLLIASQNLLDPNFAQTVVLVAVHAEEGALGLILNRETDTSFQEIWAQLKESACLREGNVWHGGPVPGSLMALHDRRALANLVVTDELFVATELDAMELLAADDVGQGRFYVAGHARHARPCLQRPRLARPLETGRGRSRAPPNPIRDPDPTPARQSETELVPRPRTIPTRPNPERRDLNTKYTKYTK
jgi:hypothetical protein